MADVVSRRDHVLLVLAVDDLAHPFDELTVVVLGEDRIPVAAQTTLTQFQPAPRKSSFELLNDLAVAADRSVEPLQVAVDDPRRRLSSFSRVARVIAPRVSGSSIFAVADERTTRDLLVSIRPRCWR